MSAIDQQGDAETLTTLALHLLLIMIEYKPPTIENLRFLIDGGHSPLKRIHNYFLAASSGSQNVEPQVHAQAVLDDLTINEYFRLLRVVHGKINLDPLYAAISQYF